MPKKRWISCLFAFVFASAAVGQAENDTPFAALFDIAEPVDKDLADAPLALPPIVRAVRVLDDGTAVLATIGDEKERAGAEENAKRHWIPGAGIVRKQNLLPTPDLIDAQGVAWYVGTARNAVATDGVSTNVFTAKSHFQGRVAEDRAGRVWLSEHTGIHLVRPPSKDAASPTTRDAKWLTTTPSGKVPKTKGRFHAILDQPTGKTVVLPRIMYSPYARSAADPIPGTLHIFDRNLATKPERATIERSGVSQAIPQSGGSWYMIPDRGDAWVWIPKEAKLPAALAKLVQDLGSENYKERQAATKEIKTTYRFWQARIAALRKTVDDPEVRMRLDDIMDDWGEAEAMKPDLPLDDAHVNWKQCNYLHTPSDSHAYLVVTVGDKKENILNPRYPFAALIRFDAEGNYEVVADNIPVAYRPGRQMSEGTTGFDLIPLKDNRYLYRDMFGRPLLLDAQKPKATVFELPDLDMKAEAVLTDTRLLDLRDDTLLMKQKDRFWIVPKLSQRLKTTKAVPIPDPQLFISSRRLPAKLREIETLRRTGGDLKAASRIADEIIEKNPHMPDGYQAKVFLLYSQNGTIGDFLQQYNHVAALSPEAADPYARRGAMWASARAHHRAIKDFNAAILLQPEIERYLIGRGESYMNVGLFEQARADYQRAIKLKPEFVHHKLKLVELAMYEDKLDEALQLIDTIVEDHPDQTAAYLQRARIHTLLRQYDKALADHDKTIELEPDFGGHYLSRANFRIFQHLDNNKAKDDLEKALKLDPENDQVLNNLAWMLATYPDPEIRNGPRAVKLATKASELNNHTADYILDTLAAAHAEAGNFSKAVHWQEKAIEAATKSRGDIESYKTHLEAFLLGIPVREPIYD